MLKFDLLEFVLKKYRYRNKNDSFKTFQNLKKSGVCKKVNHKGNILILPIRVSPISNLFEGLVAYALKLRGYKVSGLFCGKTLNVCENINFSTNKYLTCKLCNLEQKRFIDTFEINPIFYKNLTHEKKEKLKLISETVKLNEIFTYVYRGINIGTHVENGASRYLMQANIDLKLHENLIRNFFLTSLITAEITEKTLIKLNPVFVLMSHGIYSTWGVALDVCKKLKIHAIVWGRGYVGKGNIMASHNNSYIFDSITEDAKYWKDIIIDDAKKNLLDEYFNSKKNSIKNADYVNYYSSIVKKENLDIFKELKLKENKKRIGVYPNIPWDGKMFSATKEFPDLESFILAFIEWANQNEDVDLIIRSHPAEKYFDKNNKIETFWDVFNKVCLDKPKNIIHIRPDSSITSYDLSKICDAALIYASTLSLEFVYHMHPVIQVGKNNVSNKNLLFDAVDKKEMFYYLDLAKYGKLKISGNMYCDIEKYAYHWIYKKHIPEKIVELEKLQFKNYNFDNVKLLNQGFLETLDFFIERCFDKQPFIWNKCNE